MFYNTRLTLLQFNTQKKIIQFISIRIHQRIKNREEHLKYKIVANGSMNWHSIVEETTEEMKLTIFMNGDRKQSTSFNNKIFQIKNLAIDNHYRLL